MEKLKLVKFENDRLFIVGLIGGIAAGKSTIAHIFGEFGAEVIDADKIGHKALDDSHIKHEIMRLWGRQMLVAGQIDRKKLAEIVFPRNGSVNRTDLEKLENLVHPIIRRGICERLESFRKHNKHIVVLDVALLMESGLFEICDVVIFVDTPLNMRQQRAFSSRNWRNDEIVVREKFQQDLQQKKEMSDFVVCNGESQENVYQQVQKIWSNLLDISAKKISV